MAKTFWRIETGNGDGAYSSISFGNTTFWYERHVKKGIHLSPKKETEEFKLAFRALGEKSRFGFKSLAALKKWVTPKFVDILVNTAPMNESFIVKKYRVKSRYDGAAQSICHVDELARHEKSFDLFNLYLDKEIY